MTGFSGWTLTRGAFRRPEKRKRPIVWLGIVGRFPYPQGLCLYWGSRGHYVSLVRRMVREPRPAGLARLRGR